MFFYLYLIFVYSIKPNAVVTNIYITDLLIFFLIVPVFGSSSNNDIVYVDQNGIITAKSEGISTITATVDNKQAKILVSVFSNDRGENNIIENNIQKNIIHEDNGSDNINLSSNSILDEEP